MRLRQIVISVFVIVWIAVFHYETLRRNYLSLLVCRETPFARRLNALVDERLYDDLAQRCPELPKLPFLYPPAGWIMFFNVDRSYGFTEVYGVRNRQPFLIDPHEIFATRFVLYDNIHRNVLVSVLSPADGPPFCRYLHRKFPQYDAFAILYAMYPDVVNRPEEKLYQVAYQCQASQ